MLKRPPHDDDHFLGTVGILENLLRPVHTIHEFDPENDAGPEETVLDVLLGTAATVELRAGIKATRAQRRGDLTFRITTVNFNEWYVTRVWGPQATVHRLAGLAERLGAPRVTA